MAQSMERMAEMLEKQVDLLVDAGLDEVAVAAALRARRLRLMAELAAGR